MLPGSLMLYLCCYSFRERGTLIVAPNQTGRRCEVADDIGAGVMRNDKYEPSS